MEPILPKDVIYRPKTGFGAPLRRWLQQDLREYKEDLLSANTLKKRGLFDPEAVKELVALDSRGKVDAAYPIFSLICIELWMRLFIDERASKN
jgi:asparagine synthase (glutamine-hydrolysing)